MVTQEVVVVLYALAVTEAVLMVLSAGKGEEIPAGCRERNKVCVTENRTDFTPAPPGRSLARFSSASPFVLNVIAFSRLLAAARLAEGQQLLVCDEESEWIHSDF